MSRSIASGLVLFALSSAWTVAQQSRDDSCDLQVRIRSMTERIIETPVQVELLKPQGPLATVTLVGDGSAHFQVGSGKSYRLHVSGTGYQEVTTAYFSIEALEQQHTETVHLTPTAPQPGAKAPSGQAIVSVSELSIPGDAGAEMKKGLEAYAKGDMAGAAVRFEKAAAEYPKFARAYDLLGAIAIRGGDRRKGRQLLSKAIDVDATYVPAYVDLARMDLQDRQYTESEKLLNKALALNPSAPETTALLATTEFVNKEYDKALQDVQRTHALPNHAQYAEVHLMAAQVLRMQNRRAAAIEQFKLFLKEMPESPQAATARKELAEVESQRP